VVSSIEIPLPPCGDPEGADAGSTDD
jgi:hypothetical protein